jgi:hypothetical protein
MSTGVESGTRATTASSIGESTSRVPPPLASSQSPWMNSLKVGTPSRTSWMGWKREERVSNKPIAGVVSALGLKKAW